MADRANPEGGTLGKFAQLVTLGIALPTSIAVGAAIGYFLDKWLGTFPWLSLVFFCLGVAAAFINLFRVLKKFDEGA